jgi:ABC-type transport system substrate-binding protein
MRWANPLYWRGRSKLDKIVYEIVPTRDALLAQLAAHKVDLHDYHPNNITPFDNMMDVDI